MCVNDDTCRSGYSLTIDMELLSEKLTQTLQTERQKREEMVEAERHSTLQEIMDDVVLLHKQKELDDNGFCTVRDLLHSKALTQPNNPN